MNQDQSFSKQVWNNTDLVRHIYSFGDPCHRDFTSSLKWDIKAYPKLFEYRFRLWMGKNSSSRPLQDYLDQYSIEELEHYLQNFKRCHCCTRHSMNIRESITSEPAVFQNYTFNCDCVCRHLTRGILKNIFNRMIQTDM